MKPLISIVIPAYNVEKYIAQCINSINKQTFNDYEVIIVDDGSTDNTLNVVKDNITDKYKVISQKNKGAGMARNAGIEIARGKYITFMDSDDFLYNEYCLEKIASLVKEQSPDVVTYKMVRYYQNSEKFLIEDDYLVGKEIYNNSNDYLKNAIEISRLSISPCDKIIKTSIIKGNKILFKTMAMLEDIDWSLHLYKYTKKIVIYNEPIYVYRKERQGSTTSFYNQKKILACSNFVFDWCKLCKNNKEVYYDLCLHYISYQYTILLAAINKKNSTKENIKKLKSYSWLLNYDLNFKTKKAKTIYKFLGFNVMVMFLKIYMLLKNKNLILIR